MKIPNTIPDEILPSTCHVEITITYKNVYPGRDHVEYNRTDNFTVIKSDKPVSQAPTSEDNDNAVVENAPINNRSQAREVPTPQPYINGPSLQPETQVESVPEEAPITQPPVMNRFNRGLDQTVNGALSIVRGIL